MDPKRLEKLQKIQDWGLNKPSKDQDWAEDVKKENLDVKFDYQLNEMLDSHAEKVLKVEKDLDIFTNSPDVKRYKLIQWFIQMFEQQGNPIEIEGKTFQQWVDEEFESQQLYYIWKVAKLNQSIERIAKEIELRVDGYLEVKEEELKGTLPEGSKIRIPLGTTYYIDGTNGTDTFAGTRIDSTVDSTADTTHFVDDALTGADSYILNSYFFNVTRGLGSLISAFTAIDDTVTLADAITGMAAGDTYYILNAWTDLDQFTENARSAGDKVIIRRGGGGAIDDGTDLTFTSDGTIANPIVIEADFDNLWREQVDLSATGTATLTFGSKTVTFSVDVSGVVAAGDWIYTNGEDNREFAYEVASVSTVTVTLYLPYKGNQAGSGKTMFNMQESPIWNTAAGDFQWDIVTDNQWKFQGIHIRGTDSVGTVEISSSTGIIIYDCIVTGNGASDIGINFSDIETHTIIRKTRIDNCDSGAISASGLGDANNNIYVKDFLINNSTTAVTVGRGRIIMEEGTIANATTGFASPGNPQTILIRNIVFDTVTTPIATLTNATQDISTVVEDYGGTIGDNRFYNNFGSAVNIPLFQSETTTVRSGGSNKSIKVTPSATLNTVTENNRIMLFEIPIYATTNSKQYDIYFRPDATANWSADPLATELWIELEAWGHASNNFRRITKSTGVIDMNGSTDWQALSVTVAPAQAGVAYLRCWYAKTKEAGTNIFFVDPIPVIT